MWGATLAAVAATGQLQFQSTHPCGVRLIGEFAVNFDRVSIHAPVWGATPPTAATKLSKKVSIHAPVWGATDEPSFGKLMSRVSIHAPVWGATMTCY